jgi:hypothetical protein
MSDSPESAFHAYLRAFETLNPKAALPFYHVPATIIAPQGVFTAADTDAAQALLSQFMKQLQSKSYRRTEVLGLEVRKLSPDLASCSGTFVRLNVHEMEIARAGFIYIMRNTESWKIVVAVLHQPAEA